ncbi:hypothetical protein [Nostoc sp. 'Peltigera membranacea cyanobiont' N6]|uniref:hypothetical protein n=1 Tax=Nostoc sp. 'Peltigera membranacea cyanobiont' N6 TaxID=1261031 RepID=UPI000CF320C8|nr:hypothetical protein [Nostoc sp. 'Peltigera membranacea cyanobiont' N6]AVH68151.1 hypothetical protein NPM_10066 [Nostoc sp. 'Peltigera membranacea cyanobiont' N6]
MFITESKTTYNLIILKTNGYELKFYLGVAENHFLDAEIEFSVKPELLQRVFVKSKKIKISFDDLRRLINYFRNHMQSLKVDANHESYTFTDYNLVYQIQALCGFISSNTEESYFSIISMINVGKINPSSDSTYIGGESTISFNQVENFIISLENLLSYQC